MTTDLALAVLAGAALVVWLLVSLARRLRAERAALPPEERSPLWLLILGGIGAYLFAYFAFGDNLQVPWRLAFAALAVGSVPVIRRLLP